MDDSAAVRESARETLRDVDPPALRRRLLDRIDDAWLVPGELTVHAARKAGADGLSTGLRGRAAAVQLIYEGLALTRQLVHEEPWKHPGGGGAAVDLDGDEPAVDLNELVAADLDVLVADVLVARGAYLLARTEAADKAVDIIRDFGRAQTRRPRGDPGRQLEADVFELAAVAGSTAVEADPPTTLLEWGELLGDGLEGERPDLSTLVAHADAGGGGGQPAVANEGRTGSSDP